MNSYISLKHSHLYLNVPDFLLVMFDIILI